jgi:hypothetical protein
MQFNYAERSARTGTLPVVCAIVPALQASRTDYGHTYRDLTIAATACRPAGPDIEVATLGGTENSFPI